MFLHVNITIRPIERLWLTSLYIHQILDTHSALIDNSSLVYVYGNVVNIVHNIILCRCVPALKYDRGRATRVCPASCIVPSPALQESHTRVPWSFLVRFYVTFRFNDDLATDVLFVWLLISVNQLFSLWVRHEYGNGCEENAQFISEQLLQ